MFIFTLESTASSSCWAVASLEYFLPRFCTSFVEEEFQMLPSRTPPQCLRMGIPKGLLFFLTLFPKYFNGLLFYLAEATRCSLNFLQNKFLSCRCSKSVSYPNISLDCCAEHLRAAKMLYLLKYRM